MPSFFLVCAYVLVFPTGTAGLIYQVVWQRYLARLLGNDSSTFHSDGTVSQNRKLFFLRPSSKVSP